jgi:tripartite-type tricarboxylate transporter receptor subunit TctC
VDFMFEVSVGVLAQIRAGTLRPLLVTGAKPIDSLPGVPPFDSAFPGVGIEAWHGVFAPGATPRPLLEQLAADIGRAVLSPEVSARLRELGFQPTGLAYPRFNEVVARDLERWGKVIRDNHIRAD